MTILISYTSATYKAQIRSSPASGFRQIYTGTCTMGDQQAAASLVRKVFGPASALTVLEVKDPAEIKALIGKFKGKQVFRIWTFKQVTTPQP